MFGSNANVMSKKFIITQLTVLIIGLAGALATYLAPSRAEERKHELEQELSVQRAHQHTVPVTNGR
jgi:uncharacterized membrane protein YuzA (DUF378 family)